MSQSALAPAPSTAPRTDPRAADQSVMPEPSLGFVVFFSVGWFLCRPLVWAIDRAERWLVRTGTPT